MSSETKGAPVIEASKPKDGISIYFNENSLGDDYEFSETIKPKQASSKRRARVMEYIKSLAEDPTANWNLGVDTYEQQISRIATATVDKAGNLGLCSGVLTADWLRQQLPNDDIILIIETPLESRHGSPSFSAFAAIRIIVEPSGTYLYLDGLCSHRGKAGLVMDYMLKTIGKPLFDAGLIQGFKLSALGYVIGYYYKKYGYKFYDTKSDQLVENKDLNSELKKFTNYVFTSEVEDAMPEDFIDTEEISNWYEGMSAVSHSPEYKGVVKRKDLKKLDILAKDLEVHRKNPNRRETLTARLEIVREIQTIMGEVEKQIKDVEYKNITPVMEFFLKVKNYSANPGRILSRGRKKEEMAQQAVRQDLSSDGFYMYYIPERREESSTALKVEEIPPSLKSDVGHMDQLVEDLYAYTLETPTEKSSAPTEKSSAPTGKKGGRKRSRKKKKRKKRKKTRRKFRKKSKKRKKTRRRRKVKKTRRKR